MVYSNGYELLYRVTLATFIEKPPQKAVGDVTFILPPNRQYSPDDDVAKMSVLRIWSVGHKLLFKVYRVNLNNVIKLPH